MRVKLRVNTDLVRDGSGTKPVKIGEVHEVDDHVGQHLIINALAEAVPGDAAAPVALPEADTTVRAETTGEVGVSDPS